MIRACAGPSPKTVCVAFFQSGQARQEAASSRKAAIESDGCELRCSALEALDFSALDFSALDFMGSNRFWGLCGSLASRAIMMPVRRAASSIRGLMIEASGRFLQYFFGISVCIAF